MADPSAIKVLLVEDSSSDATLLQESLLAGGIGLFEVTHVELLADGIEQLRRAEFDVVLLDLSLPDSEKSDTLLRARAGAPDIPIVVMTGVDDEVFALNALRNGIQDYLVKGHASPRQTSRAIRYAIERKRMETELQRERELLEARVRERTAELSASNRDLQAEIIRRQQAEKAKSQVMRRLKDAEETERARISRDLHDRLGQGLTALKLELVLLQKQCPSLPDKDRKKNEGPEEAGKRLAGELQARLGKEVTEEELGRQVLQCQCPFAQDLQGCVTKLETLAGSLMQEAHRLAWELHPAILDDFGLDTALRRYASDWSENSGVPVDWHSQGLEQDRLPLELESTLYRVAQEALTNVARHAKARRVSILLERRPGRVSLILEDDGQGFDAAAADPSSSTNGRLGLLGMRERVSLSGGALDIESRPGAGTTIFVRVPLAPAAVKV
jgi:signal transduction histidine kinase